MKTVNFASKAELLSYVENHYPNLYIIPSKFVFDGTDMYKKNKIIFKSCGCIAEICPAGMQRGIKCKKCFGLTKEYLRDQRSPIRSKATPMSGFWGSLYYIKILTGDKDHNFFYKIGICKNGLQYRFSSKELENIVPIFEIPFLHRGDARKLEQLILKEYNKYNIKDSKLLEIYPLSSGHTETFTEDLMLLEGTMASL